MENNVYEGLPAISLLPINTVRFKVLKQVMVSIPKTGLYYKVNKEVFSEEDGEFDLFAEDSLDIPAITKVLLATGKYPKLGGNQLFTLSYITVNDNAIELRGSILDVIGVKGETNAQETDI